MKKLSLILALLTAAATVLTACGGSDNANTPADTTANAAGDNGDTAETTAEPEYVLPSYDFKGENFHIMHTDTQNWASAAASSRKKKTATSLTTPDTQSTPR